MKKTGVDTSLGRAPRLWAAAVAAVCSAGAVAHAAHPKNHVEARRNTPIVYVGVVERVDVVKRETLGFRARATVRVASVVRGARSDRPATATLEYDTWDERTPPYAGGPQYRVAPGTMLVVFADSFAAHAPPAYLLHGSKEDLLRQIEAHRAAAAGWTSEHLGFQEIDEDARRRQVRLYEALAAVVRSR